MMTLQHVPEPRRAIDEAIRALAPGGVAIALEPDNTGQRLYFDGPMHALNDALCAVARRAREARLPADVAIGPRVNR